MQSEIVFLTPGGRGLTKYLDRWAGREVTWVYLNQDVIGFHGVRDVIGVRGFHLDLSDKVEAAASELRQPYLEYLHSIGSRLGSIRWWLSSLSYRDTHISKTFLKSCYLRVALDLANEWCAEGSLLVVFADATVIRSARRNIPAETGSRTSFIGGSRPINQWWLPVLANTALHRLFFLWREGRRIVASRRMADLHRPPEQAVTILASTVSSRNIERGSEYHSFVFGGLGDALRKKGIPLAIMPIVLRDVPYSETLQKIQSSGRTVLPPHRYIGFWDLLKTALSTCSMTPMVRPVPGLAGMDISPIVEDEIRSHSTSNWPADALLMAAAVRRLGKIGFPVERFIYVYENQPWERALCWQTRRSFPEASLVGYQHAAIPNFMLKFYLSEGGESAAPLPDRIVTVGKHTAGLMRFGGYDGSMVRVGGAINFPGETVRKAAKERNRTGASELPNTVLFAASVGLEDTVDLTHKAMDLFGPGDGVDVVIKYHPAMPLSRVAPLIRRPMPTNVKISNEPILDLFKDSAVLVYTESSVCFQALAIGLPAVHLKPQFDLDMDPLDGASDARLDASNVDELRERVSWLLENREEYVNRNRDRWSELLEDMYGPVNEDSYLAFLD